MIKTELEKLIRSLSAAEKKKFKGYSNVSVESNKDYIVLFDIICSNDAQSKGSAEVQFEKMHPGKSYENTAAYLFKVLTDMLLQLRVEQDNWFLKHQALMKARLCFERSLPSRGLKELKKAQKLAAESQDNMVFYMASRMELSHIADTGFKGLAEQDLVDSQMKAKHSLQVLRQVQEHYSLYELLSYRLTLPQIKFKDDDKKRLNDLVLSELSLTTRGSQHQFESKKLHLLFQSFFFMHIGDYQSALKIFKDLNELIEVNESLWGHPPYDYLSALEGFLDSLRNIKYFNDMEYFIAKVEHLAQKQYTEHFSMMVRQTMNLYTLVILIGKKDYKNAVVYFESIKQNIMSVTTGVAKNEKYLELLFFASVAYFKTGNLPKANKYIMYAIDTEKDYKTLTIYRLCRLLHILIHAELDNVDYVHYNIRAYKRAFSKNTKLFSIEKLIFKVIIFDPKRSSNVRKRLALKQLEPKLHVISTNRKEQRFINFFDFTEWIRTSMT